MRYTTAGKDASYCCPIIAEVHRWTMLLSNLESWPAQVFYVSAFGGIGWYLAVQERADQSPRMLFGVLLGPIGLLIVACLPTIRQTAEERRRTGDHTSRPRRT